MEQETIEPEYKPAIDLLSELVHDRGLLLTCLNDIMAYVPQREIRELIMKAIKELKYHK